MKEIAHGIRERQTPGGHTVLSVYYYADPERDPATPEGKRWKESERAKYTSQGDWDKEQEIIHSAGGGERLFAELLSQWESKIIVNPYGKYICQSCRAIFDVDPTAREKTACDECHGPLYRSSFQVSPRWKRVGGFDHGKANPTAALVAVVDQDGTIWCVTEYYQPGLSPAQHAPNLKLLAGFMSAEMWADPSIFSQNQAQSDGTFKAVNDLYYEAEITNLLDTPRQFTHELTGMERILAHWLDLEHREPTLRILCPPHKRNIQRPIYGLHNDGCPNLLWELRRARRAELTATQLQTRNPTEAIVDKDNHLRDCLKYMILSLPEPAHRTPEERALEAIKNIPAEDPTSRMIRYEQKLAEEEVSDAPMIGIGRRGMSRLRR